MIDRRRSVVLLGAALVLGAKAIAQNAPPCFFSENFDASSVPAGWDIGPQVEQFDNAGNPLGTFVDAWSVAPSDTAGKNGHFPVPFRVDAGNAIMANDDADACDCDLFDARLTSPVIDLTGRLNCALECNVFVDQSFLGGAARIQASTDGSSWQDLDTITSTGVTWSPVFIDLGAFDGTSTLQLRFTWTDNGQWAAGFALDDVCLYERVTNDLAIVDAFMADVSVDAFDATQRSEVYRRIPVQQCGTTTMKVSATLMNRGTSVLTGAYFGAEAVIGGTQVAYANSFAADPLVPGERATLSVDLGWSPGAAGPVVFNWYTWFPGTDDAPDNEFWTDSLLITDQGFANGNHQMAIDRDGDDGSVGLPGDKFQAGNRFELEGADQTVTGILVRYDEATEEGARVRARLMDGLFNELAVSDVFEVSAEDLATSWWSDDLVYIPFTSPYGPVTGDVFALLETTPDSGTVRIACSGASPHGASALLVGLAESITWTSRTPIVRLAFSDQEVGIDAPGAGRSPLPRLHPNPSAGHVVLDPGRWTDERLDLQLLDASGRTVWSHRDVTERYPLDLDLSMVAPGSYRLVLSGARTAVSTSVILLR